VSQPHRAKLATEPTDAESLLALSRGEIGALGVLYDRHRNAVFQFVSRALGNGADVEDLVHATFFTATKAAASFDGRTSCRPWLIGIAGRLIHRRRRSLLRFGRALGELAIRESNRVVDPVRQLDARDRVEQVARALRKMSEPKRLVLLMAEVEHLECQEIATALDIPIGTVWTRLHHARKELTSALGREES
jgi:RNA polymerase sigma-70 factor (ECF subfamily)